MTLRILQEGDPLLREISAPVPDRLFGTPELATMVRDMAAAMDAEADGVAIAAPQVGIPYRIFLVRYDRMTPKEDGAPDRPAELGVFINPRLEKLSRKSVLSDEGCLSVRGIYGKTRRKGRASVRAKDLNGIEFVRGGGGILAQAFQHEIEHLDGVLFVDHAETLYRLAEKEENHD